MILPSTPKGGRGMLIAATLPIAYAPAFLTFEIGLRTLVFSHDGYVILDGISCSPLASSVSCRVYRRSTLWCCPSYLVCIACVLCMCTDKKVYVIYLCIVYRCVYRQVNNCYYNHDRPRVHPPPGLCTRARTAFWPEFPPGSYWLTAPPSPRSTWCVAVYTMR